ncbi:phytoene desaturase family protein [Vibrio nigripulchritudo]|uniref:phytoene desaturase family protein n=1 Tax=Vibrio nigripulchritudo TaxID=28173 RepID=UPI001EF40F7D|nr:NAD(P)/FAD-dependent oxidoreductase [Vibrio nigripulchritudo]
MMSDNRVDAVLIGSGINSLVCALILQSKGWKVHIAEQSSVPGGAVKTGEYTAKGYRHDWAAMNLSLFAGSPFFTQYGSALLGHGLDLVPVKHCFASVFPDGKWLGISQDVSLNTERIQSFSHKDAHEWQSLTKQFSVNAPVMVRFLQSPFRWRTMCSNVWQTYREIKLSGALKLLRLMLSSPREWLDDHFESEHVKSTLAAWGMHLDFAPDIAGGAIFPYLESFANQSFGMVIGKGGADTITNAMVNKIREAGGIVECGTRVEEILNEKGKAVGVHLEDGRTINANKAVIANVSPSALSHMLERFKGENDQQKLEEEVQAYRAFKHAPGTMMIHLALEALPNWTASQELQKFAYVHIAPSMNQMAKTYQQALSGELPEEPVIVVGQPTSVDPTRAPENKHTLWIQVRMLPSEAQLQEQDQTWQTLADSYSERVLDIVERYAPGLRKNIVSTHVVSPAELEKDNPNLVGGDQLCGSHHLNQNFWFRPILGRSDGTTSVSSLYHTGAAVWPGAGTGAGAGFLLAKKLTE